MSLISIAVSSLQSPKLGEVDLTGIFLRMLTRAVSIIKRRGLFVRYAATNSGTATRLICVRSLAVSLKARSSSQPDSNSAGCAGLCMVWLPVA